MSTKTFLHKLNRKDTRIFPGINTLTKIVFIALIAITITFFTKNILAQNAFKDKQDAIAKGNNQESWLNEAMGSNIVSLCQQIVGVIPFDAQGNLQATFVPGGAIGSTNKMIASLYHPPASGIEYIAQVKDSFLGKPAYAQGIGFPGLNPILPIWRSFRNVIYVVSAIVFVVIGIMIMLRVKISPQAVVTIQSAIPGIITTLILVTFSYAIAGLLIDLTYFFQALVLAILFNSQAGSLTSAKLFQSGLFGLGYNPSFNDLSQAGFGDVFSLMFKATPVASLWILGGLPGALIGGIVGSAFAGIGAIPGVVVGLIVGGILPMVIIVIMLLIWLIKFFFGLLKCYIVVILKIVLGPLEIGMGAFPNSKLGFSSWFIDLIANLAVFPISLIFLVLANMIIDASTKGLWQPNIIGGSVIGGAVNLSASASGGIFSVALGIATILMLSKLPKMIPEFVFSIKPSPWGKALGEAAGNIPIVSNGIKSVQKEASERFGAAVYNKVRHPINEYRAGAAAQRRRREEQNNPPPAPTPTGQPGDTGN